MNKSIVYGIIVCLLVSGGLMYWYLQTKPISGEVDSLVIKISQVDPNLLVSNTAKSLKNLEKNGNIPVKAQLNVPGKTNPF